MQFPKIPLWRAHAILQNVSIHVPNPSNLRSQQKVETFRGNLMKLHDELADLKSYFDGQKGSLDDTILF